MEIAKKDPEEVDTSISVQSYDRSQLPELLRIYYTWLFPYDRYFEWLQYGKHFATFVPIIRVQYWRDSLVYRQLL